MVTWRQIGDSGDSLVVRQVRDSHLQGQVGVVTEGEVGDNHVATSIQMVTWGQVVDSHVGTSRRQSPVIIKEKVSFTEGK